MIKLGLVLLTSILCLVGLIVGVLSLLAAGWLVVGAVMLLAGALVMAVAKVLRLLRGRASAHA